MEILLPYEEEFKEESDISEKGEETKQFEDDLDIKNKIDELVISFFHQII